MERNVNERFSVEQILKVWEKDINKDKNKPKKILDEEEKTNFMRITKEFNESIIQDEEEIKGNWQHLIKLDHDNENIQNIIKLLEQEQKQKTNNSTKHSFIFEISDEKWSNVILNLIGIFKKKPNITLGGLEFSFVEVSFSQATSNAIFKLFKYVENLKTNNFFRFHFLIAKEVNENLLRDFVSKIAILLKKLNCFVDLTLWPFGNFGVVYDRLKILDSIVIFSLALRNYGEVLACEMIRKNKSLRLLQVALYGFDNGRKELKINLKNIFREIQGNKSIECVTLAGNTVGTNTDLIRKLCQLVKKTQIKFLFLQEFYEPNYIDGNLTHFAVALKENKSIEILELFSLDYNGKTVGEKNYNALIDCFTFNRTIKILVYGDIKNKREIELFETILKNNPKIKIQVSEKSNFEFMDDFKKKNPKESSRICNNRDFFDYNDFSEGIHSEMQNMKRE